VLVLVLTEDSADSGEGREALLHEETLGEDVSQLRRGGDSDWLHLSLLDHFVRKMLADVNMGNYTFFLKFFLENEIFLDNLNFFVPIFSNFDCIFLENAIKIF
jgi:hypothetical protein